MRLNPETGLKLCPCCEQDKPANAFWRSSKHKSDGLQIRCIECKKKWREDNYIRYMILACRNRAKIEGVPCTITEADIHIPDNCPIHRCLRPLKKATGRAQPDSPSLDRYNPALGYAPGNIWIICQGCNRDKQNMSGEDHVAFGIDLINSFKEECERLAKLQAA